MFPTLPPKPLNEQVVDHEKLEYPLVPPDYSQKVQIKTDLPEYFNELSTSKLQELIKSPEILHSYLYQNSNFASISESIKSTLEKQLEYTDKLLDQTNDKLAPQTESINKQLDQYHQKLKTFDQLQVQMYDHLNKYSKNSIIRTVEHNLTVQDNATSSLIDQVLKSPSQIDEAQLSTLISAYTSERQEYYLILEKLHRLYEDRTGGLSNSFTAGCKFGSFPKPANTCSQSSLAAAPAWPASAPPTGSETEKPGADPSKLLKLSNCEVLKESSACASSSPRSSNMSVFLAAENGFVDLSATFGSLGSSPALNLVGLEMLSWNSSLSLDSSSAGFRSSSEGVCLGNPAVGSSGVGSSEVDPSGCTAFVAGEYKSSSSSTGAAGSPASVVPETSVVALETVSWDSVIPANSPGMLPGMVY
ncbi:hypothetical protein OGAPHI_003689 [Ogataea philodendri]|uniref:VPS37 C-terminal domain-containing protein n=1 Tax=Ogataea philodendri TaxID=1378263 RepID=A0A9P8P4P6_9ASCO|nr:uncharacterized protein OGAPHI_003689 [Ogataea philodendri]KAH3665503.1 hypothetical protein OGAPHI_003689 [Ogataea philodendri]